MMFATGHFWDFFPRPPAGEWQYQHLSDEARREGKSISQLVREWLTEWIESRRAQTWKDDPFDHHFRQMGITVAP